jgi:hypothetical protein
MLHLIFLCFSMEKPNMGLIMLHPDRERSVHQLRTRNIIGGISRPWERPRLWNLYVTESFGSFSTEEKGTL